MAHREQLIEEIVANIHAIKHKMQSTILQDAPVSSSVRGAHPRRITPAQWFVLAIVEQHKNVGVKHVASMLGITSSATTQLIDALAKSGYVLRKADARDRRALHLALSSRGRARMEALKNKHARQFAVLFNALNDRELERYARLHRKIVAPLFTAV